MTVIHSGTDGEEGAGSGHGRIMTALTPRIHDIARRVAGLAPPARRPPRRGAMTSGHDRDPPAFQRAAGRRACLAPIGPGPPRTSAGRSRSSAPVTRPPPAG
ncbi:MAG: hypothetical protein ACRDN0_23040, partial [Trebonia sp.]